MELTIDGLYRGGNDDDRHDDDAENRGIFNNIVV